jgi:transposase
VGAIAIGHRNGNFAGSDKGGRLTAALYTVIAIAKLSDIDPQVWVADMVARLTEHPDKRLVPVIGSLTT